MQIYPWLEPVWKKLKANLEHQHIPGALLIQAKQGLAPEALINRYVSGLMCQNDASEPCGFCHSCDLLKSESHPDVHFLLPEKDKKHLSVDQIRAANKWALESSQFGRYRVIVIPNADRMNTSAANALLKTLEEPPAHCLFLLSTENTKLLLPTIRSRCEVWHVSQPSEQVCLGWVNQTLDQSVSPRIAYLCQFEPITTLEFVEKGWDTDFHRLVEAFSQFMNSDGMETGELWTLMTKSSADIDRQLSWLWMLLSAAQKQALGINMQPLSPESEMLTQRYGYELLFSQTLALQELSEQLRSAGGLNTELLFTNWLYGFNPA